MLACCYRYHVSKCIFLYLCTRVEKIHLDTTYLNVSFCIFPPRSERYIKIHLDWFRYTCIQFAVSTHMKSNGYMKRHFSIFSEINVVVWVVVWSLTSAQLKTVLSWTQNHLSFFSRTAWLCFQNKCGSITMVRKNPAAYIYKTPDFTWFHMISHDSIHSSNFCTKKENSKNIDFSKSQKDLKN